MRVYLNDPLKITFLSATGGLPFLSSPNRPSSGSINDTLYQNLNIRHLFEQYTESVYNCAFIYHLDFFCLYYPFGFQCPNEILINIYMFAFLFASSELVFTLHCGIWR